MLFYMPPSLSLYTNYNGTLRIQIGKIFREASKMFDYQRKL